MVPADGEQSPSRSIGMQAFIYALFLLPVVIAPYYMGVVGWVSTLIALVLTLSYVGFSWRFYKQASRKAALQLMFFSFTYIPVVLLAMFADKV